MHTPIGEDSLPAPNDMPSVIPPPSSSALPSTAPYDLSSTQNPATRGIPIMCLSAPFGVLCPRALRHSASVGIISTTFAHRHRHRRDGHVFLVDCRVLPCCEGAPVYDKTGQILGLMTIPMRRHDVRDAERAIGLNLVVPTALLRDWVTEVFDHPHPHLHPHPGHPYNHDTAGETSLVAVRVGRSWATAVLLGKHGYVMSNAHVVRPFMKELDHPHPHPHLPSTTVPIWALLKPENFQDPSQCLKPQWHKAELVYCCRGPWDICLFKLDIVMPLPSPTPITIPIPISIPIYSSISEACFEWCEYNTWCWDGNCC